MRVNTVYAVHGLAMSISVNYQFCHSIDFPVFNDKTSTFKGGSGDCHSMPSYM